MRRVLIFSLQYYPLVGGAEVALREITDRISPEEIEFHMLTLRFNIHDPHTERIGNVMVHRVGTNGSYLSKIFFVLKAARTARILHLETPFNASWAMMSYMVFPIALLRITGMRVPYVLTLQDGDPFERVFGRWYIQPLMPLLRYGFRHASSISVLSHYLAAWPKRIGYPQEPIVIPNGADIARFSNAAPSNIGKKPGETWLVTSSRLVHKNAIDDVIRALALLPERVQFLILGAGPDEEMLHGLAQTLGVTDRVVFKGYITHTELPGYLKACDIFIRPSRTEGFGASFTEAFAAGLPVIATQEGGIKDFLFDAKRNPAKPPTGFAVDRDTPPQIAEAVKRIIADPEGTAKVTSNAHRLVTERYDWNLIARQMRAFILQICES